MLTYAQTLQYSGPVSTSMAHVRVLDASAWATLTNVSNLATHKLVSVGAAYQLRFNLEELSSRAATFVVPTSYGTCSALLLQSGYQKSHYNRYALSYSRLFGSKVAVGFQYNYLSHYLEGADRSDAFYLALGLKVHTTEMWTIGVFIQNPEQSKIAYTNTSYALPTFFNVAVQWSAASHFMMITEFEKEIEHDLVLKTGMQFNFNNKVMVRGGLKAKPVEFTFGSGFQFGGLGIDVGFSHHQQLGLTSSAGLTYAFNHKKQIQ